MRGIVKRVGTSANGLRGRIAHAGRDIGARARDQAARIVLPDQTARPDAHERSAVHAAAEDGDIADGSGIVAGKRADELDIGAGRDVDARQVEIANDA